MIGKWVGKKKKVQLFCKHCGQDVSPVPKPIKVYGHGEHKYPYRHAVGTDPTICTHPQLKEEDVTDDPSYGI